MFEFAIDFADGLSRFVRGEDEKVLEGKRLLAIREWHADQATEIVNISEVYEV